MKLTKIEKIWLLLTTLFYVLYNLPGVPGLGDSGGMIIHASLTIIPIWVVTYVCMPLVYKKYRLRKTK